MTVATLLRHMSRLDACEEATEWVQGLPADMPASDAWQRCERADWLLWLAGRAGVDCKLVVLVACDCARLALPIWQKRYPEDGRVLACIDTVERWTRGEATIEDVRAARRAADAASYAAAADAAYAYADAAYAAAAAASYAAYAYADAAYAAAAAASYAANAYAYANAAYAAANAYAYAYADADADADADARRAARASTLRQCADLTRARITWDTVERALVAQDGAL